MHEAYHDKIAAHLYRGSGSSLQPVRHAAFSQPPRISTMATKSRGAKGRDDALSLLNRAIDAVDLAKEDSGITQAKAAFGSVGVLFTMIRVSFLLPIDQPLANVVYRTR